jgi:photosystem II stability/assembly factor-like uncharacterized protein
MGIPYQDLVRDMSFSGKNNGTIVCDLGMIVKTTNAGSSWVMDSTFYQYFQRSYGIDLLRGVHMVDTSLAFISGGGGSIYRSTNAGQSWTILNGGYFDLHGTHFVNANSGWAVGEEGTLQKTTNGGTNWSFYPQITREVLRDVMFPSANTGYISGDSGVILKTTNAGTNWFFLNSGTRINLFDIFFVNNETGFAGGGFTSGDSIGTGTIIKTIDGGLNWSRSFYSQDSGWVNALHFFDASTGVACFDASITRTTNGGANWITVGYSSTGRGLDMSFPNSETGYAAGGSNTFYKTTNSGISWLGYSTGNPGIVIQTIHFINSLKGFAAGPYGEILYTENGGINWSISKNVSDNYITCINFSDSLNGRMTGFLGTILRTTNGGISFIGSEAQQLPGDFQLYQNYPNPFNPVTTIGFSLKKSADVKIVLTNILGEQVRVLTDKRMSAGEHELILNLLELPTGVYFYSLIANGSVVQTKKLLLIK